MKTELFLLFATVSLGYAYEKQTMYCGDYYLTYFAGGQDNIPWCEALVACSSFRYGSVLAMPNKKSVMDNINGLLSSWGNPRTWIGATDMYNEGYWVWPNGTPLYAGYTHWNSKQPDNARGKEHCATVNCKSCQTGYWNDYPCNDKFGYICQVATTSSVSSDYTSLSFSDLTLPGDTKSHKELSFDEAEQMCKNKGIRLTQISNNRFKEKLINDLKNSATRYWIKDGGTGCKTISATGIETTDCNELHHFICEGIEPFRLIVSNIKYVSSETSNIEVKCSASGLPLPHMTWYKDGNLITTEAKKRIHQLIGKVSSTLVVNNAKLSDTGRYHCVAENIINSTRHAIKGYTDLKVLSLENYLRRNVTTISTPLPTPETNNEPQYPACGCACSSNKWMLPTIIVLSVISINLIGIVAVLFYKRCKEAAMRNDKEVKEMTSNAVTRQHYKIFSFLLTLKMETCIRTMIVFR